MDISRRFFLGGAISLVAATTFAPSISAMMNLPTIYGDGVRDDTSGLYALLHNEPCTFNKEQIGVENHEGIIFHKGYFIIKNTIEIQKETKLIVEAPHFIGLTLDSNQPFFMCEKGFKANQFDRWATFHVEGHRGKLIDYKKEKYEIESDLYNRNYKNLKV
jgi:hypothetical protein